MDVEEPGLMVALEARRLAAVRHYDVLDTPADVAFDRITAMAARRFAAPVAVISIVDCDRIWFKSAHGLQEKQISLDLGLCATAMLGKAAYILPDASRDARSCNNPLVAGPLGVRFYAGVPLRVKSGESLGVLSVLDVKPREVDQSAIDDLIDMGSLVVDQLELRLAALKALGQSRLLAREADHRVMNSLQFIAGVLAMQSRMPSAQEAVEHLEAAANRIAAVAQVHRNFYANSGSGEERVSCVAFLRVLCDNLSGIIGRPVEVFGEEGYIPHAQIQPIGLIVNELVTNAAKHGSGKIEVAYSRASRDVHELSVSDEGDGLPVDFDASKSSGLGMKVVTILAGQLGGQVTAAKGPRGNGACYTVAFAA